MDNTPCDVSSGGDDTALIDLSEAAKRLPNRPHTSTLWRWARKGVRSRAGGRVRLEVRRLGGKLFTTAEALDRFGRELAEADAAHFASDADDTNVATTTITKARRREIDRAEAELTAAGI